MHHCAVRNCLARYGRNRNSHFPENNRFHRFPRNAALRDVWLKASSKPDTPNWCNYRMCSCHFTLDDYKRDLQHELMGYQRKWILKPEAVPTLFLSGNHTESKRDAEKDALKQDTGEYKVDNISKRSNPGKRVIKRKRAYSPDNYQSTSRKWPSTKRSKRQSVCSRSRGAKRQKIGQNVKSGNVSVSHKPLNVLHNVIENKSSTCPRRSRRTQINDHHKLEVIQESKQDRELFQPQQSSKSEERIHENEKQAHSKQETVMNGSDRYPGMGIKEEICEESNQLSDQCFVGIKEEVLDIPYNSSSPTSVEDFEGTILGGETDNTLLTSTYEEGIKQELGLEHLQDPGTGDQSRSLIVTNAHEESLLSLLSAYAGRNCSPCMDGASVANCFAPFISRGVERCKTTINGTDPKQSSGNFVTDFVPVKEEPEVPIEESDLPMRLELNDSPKKCSIGANEEGKFTMSEDPFSKECLPQKFQPNGKDQTCLVSSQALFADKAFNSMANQARDCGADTAQANNQHVDLHMMFDLATSTRFNVESNTILRKCSTGGLAPGRNVPLNGTLLQKPTLHQRFPCPVDGTILHTDLSCPKALGVDSKAISMASPVISSQLSLLESVSDAAFTSKGTETTADHTFPGDMNAAAWQVCDSGNINKSSYSECISPASKVDLSNRTKSIGSLSSNSICIMEDENFGLDAPQIVKVEGMTLTGIDTILKVEGMPFSPELEEVVNVEGTPLSSELNDVVKVQGTPLFSEFNEVKIEGTSLSSELDEVVKIDGMEHCKFKKIPRVSTVGSFTGKMYTCSKCTYTTSNSKFLLIHSSTHLTNSNSSNVNGVFRCSQCSYSTFNIDQFLSHNADHLTTRLAKHVVASPPNGRGDEACPEVRSEDTAMLSPRKSARNQNKIFFVKTIGAAALPSSQWDSTDGMVQRRCFYRCSKCNYITGNNREFAHHQRYQHTQVSESATRSGNFSCAHCNHASTNINEFLSHTQVHNTNNSAVETNSNSSSGMPPTSEMKCTDGREPQKSLYHCPKCNYTTGSNREFAHHQKYQHNESLKSAATSGHFSCAQCTHVGDNIDEFLSHTKVHNTNNPAVETKSSSSSGMHLVSRVQCTDDVLPGKSFYRCSKCDYSTGNNREFAHHQKYQHIESLESVARLGHFSCAQCTHVSTNIDEFLSHTKICCKNNPFGETNSDSSSGLQICTLKGAQTSKIIFTKHFTKMAPKSNFGMAEDSSDKVSLGGPKEQRTKQLLKVTPKLNSAGAESCSDKESLEFPKDCDTNHNKNDLRSNSAGVENCTNKGSTVVHKGLISVVSQSTGANYQQDIDTEKSRHAPPLSNWMMPDQPSASDILKQTFVTPERFHCRRCSFTAVDINIFLEHIKGYCKKNSMPQESEQNSKMEALHCCSRCSFSTHDVKLFDQHSSFHTLKDSQAASQKFYCRLCPTTSYDLDSFIEHTECHNQTPAARFGCLECPFTSDILDDFLEHTRSHEKAGSPKSSERRFSCSLCPYSCDDIDDFLEHTSGHESSLSKYVCKLCFLRFTTAALLKHHTISCRVNGRIQASAQPDKSPAVVVTMKALKLTSKISTDSSKQTAQDSKILLASNDSELSSKEVPTLDVTVRTLLERDPVSPNSVSSNDASSVSELRYHASKMHTIPDSVIQNIQIASISKSQTSSTRKLSFVPLPMQAVADKLLMDSRMYLLSDGQNSTTHTESNNKVLQCPLKSETFLNGEGGSEGVVFQLMNRDEEKAIQKSAVGLVPSSQKSYLNSEIRSVAGGALRKFLINKKTGYVTNVELREKRKSCLGIKGEDNIVRPNYSYGVKRYKGVTCYTFASFQCKMCMFRCDTKTALSEHVSGEHGIRSDPLSIRSSKVQFICPVCLTNEGFSTKTALVAHAKTHMYRGKHACKHCDFKDDDDFVVEAHARDHWLEGKLVCRHCIPPESGKQLKDAQRKVSHVGNTTEQGQRGFCGKNGWSSNTNGSVDNNDTGRSEHDEPDFLNEDDLPIGTVSETNKSNEAEDANYHQSNAADYKNKSDAETGFTCKPCNYKTICKTDYKVHLILHLGSSMKCRRCDFSTYSTECFYHHSKTHPENLIKCPHCPFSSFVEHNLKKHLARHTGEGVYSCHECEFTTYSHPVLQRHMTSHTGVGLLECPHCDYKNPYKRQLRVHMKRHTGEGMYTCPECNFTSAYKNIFKEHCKIHTNEKLLECTREDCHFDTPYRTSFIDHMKRHQIKDKGLATSYRPRPKPWYSCEQKWTLLFASIYAGIVHKDKTLKQAACLHEIWCKRYPKNPSVGRKALIKVASLALVALKKNEKLFDMVKEGTAAMVESEACPFTAPVPLIEHAHKLKVLWNNVCRKWQAVKKFRPGKKFSDRHAQEKEPADDPEVKDETDSSKGGEASKL